MNKKYKHLSKAEEKEIIDRHFHKRISQDQLAKEYDTNRTTVSILCRSHGGSPLLKSYTLNDKEIVRMYIEEKKSVLQIANILGVTTRPIGRRLRLAGVDYHPKMRRELFAKTVPNYYIRMRIWGSKVIERDGIKCKWCGVGYTQNSRLEANHIVPIRDMETPDLLFDMNNGITLCRKCHMKIHYHEKEYEIFFRNLIRTTSSV